MKTINIGFIGGCLNKQQGLARKEHYYSVLAARFKQDLPGLDCHFSFSPFLSYADLGKQTTKITGKWSCDIIVVFLRPYPLMPMNKILVRYRSSPEKTSWVFHPALFNRALHEWPGRLTRYESQGDFVFTPRMKFGLRDLNLVFGMLAGLNYWSSAYIEQKVLSLNLSLAASGKKLLVFTVPGYPSSLAGDFICRRSSADITGICNRENISFVDLYSESSGLFMHDGIHFTADGHRFIASRVFDKISQMI